MKADVNFNSNTTHTYWLHQSSNAKTGEKVSSVFLLIN
jgi:hypothetical protein